MNNQELSNKCTISNGGSLCINNGNNPNYGHGCGRGQTCDSNPASRTLEVTDEDDKRYLYKTILYGVEFSDISIKKKENAEGFPFKVIIEVDPDSLEDNEFVDSFYEEMQFNKNIYSGEISADFIDNVLKIKAYKHDHQKLKDVTVY